MSLVWKLLRSHLSVPQFAGFVFANLFGMLVVLLGYQFYNDIMPVFTSQDSFMKPDYLIISKKTGVTETLSGRDNSFDEAEIDNLSSRPFVKRVGRFTSSEYRVDADMGINGRSLVKSEMFFESVPDSFVDISLDNRTYVPGGREIPVILPRTYINMYNFGFARTRSLPKINDGLAGMIDFHIYIRGNGRHDEFRGKVKGFSNRLNTILVPQSFMDWSNARYAPENTSAPVRLIVEVANPADNNIAKFLDDNGYEVDDDKLQNEKTTYFLRMLVTAVVSVGLLISVLSFYILMLSIYLLVQKNASKLENLLLIGYSPLQVARPYILLTLGLNAVVLLLAVSGVTVIRSFYMDIVATLYPGLAEGSMFPSLLLGFSLFVLVSVLNYLVISRKIKRIWWRRD